MEFGAKPSRPTISCILEPKRIELIPILWTFPRINVILCRAPTETSIIPSVLQCTSMLSRPISCLFIVRFYSSVTVEKRYRRNTSFRYVREWVSLCVPNTKIFGKGSGCCCLHNNFHWVQHPNSYRSPQCHISHKNGDFCFWPLKVTQAQIWLCQSKVHNCFQKVLSRVQFVSDTVFKIFRIKGLWSWPLTSQGHLKPMGTI